jgi:hypothetical protein
MYTREVDPLTYGVTDMRVTHISVKVPRVHSGHERKVLDPVPTAYRTDPDRLQYESEYPPSDGWRSVENPLIYAI